MKIVLTVLLLTLSSLSMAGGYIGASYTGIQSDITDHTGVNLRAGYAFNDVVSMEGRYMVNTSEESYDGVNVELDPVYGAYVILALPLTDSVSPYVVAGYTYGEAKASYGGYSETADESSSSIGIGIRSELTENWTANAEYLQAFDDIDMISIGLQLNF
jgi:opacity protein-like surface antigen